MYWNHIQDNMGRRRKTGVKVLLTHNTWLVQSQGAKNRIHKIQIYANKFVVCQVSGSHTKFYANIRLFSFVYLDPAFFIWWIFCLSQSWPGCLRCLIVLCFCNLDQFYFINIFYAFVLDNFCLLPWVCKLINTGAYTPDLIHKICDDSKLKTLKILKKWLLNK